MKAFFLCKPLNQPLYPLYVNDVECGKKKNLEEAQAQALDMQGTQPPTSELVIALRGLPRRPTTTTPNRERVDGGDPERLRGGMCGGRDGPLTTDHRSRGL